MINNIDKDSLVEVIKETVVLTVNEVMNASKQSDKEYLTRDEVCEMLNISLATIHRHTKAGILNPIKIGNRVLFRKSDIVNMGGLNDEQQ